MNPPSLSRRALLLSSVAALGCGRKKATGFPGYCLVADRQGRSVVAVDLNRFQVRARIPLGAAPGAIIGRPDPEKPRAYVLAPESGAIYEIDVASLALRRKASAGSHALGIRLSPRNDAIWAVYREPAALVEFPLDSFRPSRRIPLPKPPDAFDISEDGRAAIASIKGGAVFVASLTGAAIERVITARAEPSLVMFRQDGRQLITGSAPGRSLTIFDAATGKTVVHLPLAVAPRHFCQTPDGGQLFVTGDGLDAVVIVFPYSTEVDQTVLAGHAPGAMTVTETSPSYLLVANPSSNSITAIDVDTRRLAAVVQVGQAPGQIVLTPDKNQYALAINEDSGDLAVIRLATFADGWVRRYKSASLFTLIPVGAEPVAAAVVPFSSV